MQGSAPVAAATSAATEAVSPVIQLTMPSFPALVTQALPATAAAQPAPVTLLSDDAVTNQELLRQLIAHMAAASSSPSGSPAEPRDQSQVIAAQAAQLAAARQAMQLLAQLLESGADVSQLFETAAQMAGHAVMSGQQAGPAQDGLQSVLSQATQPATAAGGDFAQDQSELMAAQAAELSSARQAMQLMLQLLEQQGAAVAVGEPAPFDVRRATDQAAVQTEAPTQAAASLQLSMQEALSIAVGQVPAGPSAAHMPSAAIQVWPQSRLSLCLQGMIAWVYVQLTA